MIKKWNRFECEKRTTRIEWRLPEDWSTTRLRLIVWLRIHTHETETSRGDPTTQHPETNTIPSATRSRLKLVLFVTSLFFILKFYTVYLFKDWRSTRMNQISHKILILKKHPFQILKFFFRSYFLFFSFCRSTQKKNFGSTNKVQAAFTYPMIHERKDCGNIPIRCADLGEGRVAIKFLLWNFNIGVHLVLNRMCNLKYLKTLKTWSKTVQISNKVKDYPGRIRYTCQRSLNPNIFLLTLDDLCRIYCRDLRLLTSNFVAW